MMKLAIFLAVICLSSSQLLWQRYYDNWPQVVTVPLDNQITTAAVQLTTFGFINSPLFDFTTATAEQRRFITAKYNSGFNTGFAVTTFTPLPGFVLVSDPLTMNYRQSRPFIAGGYTGNLDVNTAYEFERHAVVVATPVQNGLPVGVFREGDVVILHTSNNLAADFNLKCFGHPQIILNSAAQSLLHARVYCLVDVASIRVRVHVDAKSGAWHPNSVVADYTIPPIPHFITTV
jgi:hypothetical protein